jgi:hypothetical protein
MSTLSLLPAPCWFLVDLLFNPEDGGDIFLRNASCLSTRYKSMELSHRLFKNFPKSYATRKFITAFTRALYWSLPWARLIQSISPNPTSLTTILILPSHACLVLPSDFLLAFPTNPKWIPFLLHVSYMPCLSHPPSLDLSNFTWWRVLVTWLLIMQFSLTSYYLIPLGSKYSPQHPVLKYPQSMFFPYCQRPSFIHIQNYR